MNDQESSQNEDEVKAEAELKTVRLVWDVSLRLTTIWGLGVSALIVAGWMTSRSDIDSVRRKIDLLEASLAEIKGAAPIHNEQNVTIENPEGALERETRRLLARGKHADL